MPSTDYTISEISPIVIETISTSKSSAHLPIAIGIISTSEIINTLAHQKHQHIPQ